MALGSVCVTMRTIVGKVRSVTPRIQVVSRSRQWVDVFIGEFTKDIRELTDEDIDALIKEREARRGLTRRGEVTTWKRASAARSH